MARFVSIETDEKNVVRTVILRVVDRNTSGRTLVLRRPVTKIVIFVGNNEFHSQQRSPERMFTMGAILGEPDETAHDKPYE